MLHGVRCSLQDKRLGRFDVSRLFVFVTDPTLTLATCEVAATWISQSVGSRPLPMRGRSA